jgi:hypothetical protein
LLVREVATSPRHVAAYLWHLVWTLPIGFKGAVSMVNALGATQDALREYAASTSRGRVYGRHWKPSERAALDAPGPRPTPDAVGPAMKQELARGSYWRPGEAYTEPTLADVQRLRLELDPNVFDRTVEAFVEGRGELRSPDVHAHLYGHALVDSATPNARERGRVSALLDRAGFVQVEIKAEGKRARVWRRPAGEVA